ncbi:hypothetical protein CGRA01v4_05066 [Colletotrichum graminicola]|nr:hypothetical protein CGRA01v4_05066 [Colletotrichum graminicola]
MREKPRRRRDIGLARKACVITGRPPNCFVETSKRKPVRKIDQAVSRSRRRLLIIVPPPREIMSLAGFLPFC